MVLPDDRDGVDAEAGAVVGAADGAVWSAETVAGTETDGEEVAAAGMLSTGTAGGAETGNEKSVKILYLCGDIFSKKEKYRHHNKSSYLAWRHLHGS